MSLAREHKGEAQQPLAGKRVLIIVENLPLPFDRRVWQEARTLRGAGAIVSIICPLGKGATLRKETLEGIDIYRHPMPPDADNALGYLREYGAALFWETVLAWRIFLTRRFDVIHGCNPPDLIFLIAWQFRIFGVKYIFDHHDVNPELYEAKFNKRGFFWQLMKLFERITFASAHVSIATNQSYRKVAIERGKMAPEKVFVVRSGPETDRIKVVLPVASWRNGRNYLVGYVGVMGQQEGIDLLIEAVAHIVFVKQRHDIQFCLVGGGPSLAGLIAMAEKKGLSDFITFTGRVSDDDLFQVLSTADVGVNPDRVNPMNDISTMNKILEYLAFSKPIVQFDVVEGRFSADKASLYAAPNDPIDFAEKIIFLIDNPEIRAEMATFGRVRFENELSWDFQKKALIDAYITAFGGDRAGS